MAGACSCRLLIFSKGSHKKTAIDVTKVLIICVKGSTYIQVQQGTRNSHEDNYGQVPTSYQQMNDVLSAQLLFTSGVVLQQFICRLRTFRYIKPTTSARSNLKMHHQRIISSATKMHAGSRLSVGHWTHKVHPGHYNSADQSTSFKVTYLCRSQFYHAKMAEVTA